MPVTSPTPCDGCTALSPTTKSGAGGRGSGGPARKEPGAPGRNDGRCGTGGATGGAEGLATGSGAFEGGLDRDFTGDFEATGPGATGGAEEPKRAGRVI